ncbi:flagellar hook capping FlgD N-terminal domain-containing protein [Leifsonia sp. YIM 134122]|uniref:Flagellar hook capping FlgD N-terminal domain-containing protein n=1 Tax=Leifsonia stereocauli TaxID=3134136 RepID=A0ABU9W2H9_9MICO
MTIDAVAATSGMYASTPARTPKQSLDAEAFMSLLVAQLRSQDPSSPMDSNQMIAQTTQLAMMEKMTELATTSTEDFGLQMRIAAAALVGKEVSFLRPDGTTATGVVSSVSYTGSVPTVTVGKETVALDLVSSVSTAS